MAASLAALGIVFGDIGTSPLYALRECFSGFTGLSPSPDERARRAVADLLGADDGHPLKYVLFVMRADNRGEGGVLALMALVSRAAGIPSAAQRRAARHVRRRAALRRRVITPGDLGAERGRGPDRRHARLRAGGRADRPRRAHRACSSSSAAAPAPSAAVRAGHAASGSRSCARSACRQIVQQPEVLAALSPQHAVAFVWQRRPAFVVLGSVFLAVTGGEALYADMGHFGRGRSAWPGSSSCCRRCSSTTSARVRCCWRIRPRLAIRSSGWRRLGALPAVVLATAATVIASQALISGAFSMTRQARTGLSAAGAIRHTSAHEFGQVYVPTINWMLLAGVVGWCSAFQSRAVGRRPTASRSPAPCWSPRCWCYVRGRAWKWRLGLVVLVLPPCRRRLFFRRTR